MINSPYLTIRNPEFSGWVCYLFGGSKEFSGLTWHPVKGQVPNFFHRWMMKIFFGCTWVPPERARDDADVRWVWAVIVAFLVLIGVIVWSVRH